MESKVWCLVPEEDNCQAAKARESGNAAEVATTSPASVVSFLA